MVLIEHRILTEPTQHITFNREPDGTRYNFSECMCIIKHSTDTVIHSGYIYFYSIQGAIMELITAIQIDGRLSNKGATYVYQRTKGKYWSSLSYGVENNFWEIDWLGRPRLHFKESNTTFKNYTYQSGSYSDTIPAVIGTFNIGCRNNDYLQPGTEIYIYATRK